MPVGKCTDAHRGLDFVDVLSAFAARAEGVDFNVRRIDFDRRGIGDFGNHIDAGKRSVPAFVRVEWRDADEPMHAAFGVQIAVGILAADEERRRLNADFFAGLDVDRLRGEAAPLDPALIHAEEHVGPITRLGAAGAGMNGDKRVRPVVRPGKELAQLELLKLVDEARVFGGDVLLRAAPLRGSCSSSRAAAAPRSRRLRVRAPRRD